MPRFLPVAVLILSLTGSCSLDLEPAPPIIQARFDPEAGVVPMPTDILRDEEAGRLDVPTDDDDLTAAEREFYAYLNTLDGWSSTQPATVEFTDAIDERSVDEETVQLWEWGETPARVTDATVQLEHGDTELVIDAPREGWKRGHTYVAMVRGGPAGLRGLEDETVECDAAFYFLRLEQRLDDPKHNRAFPGDTRDERMQKARDLEEIRQDLQPYFSFFEERGVPRREVAALWAFTVTERVELAMDKPSQRMPVPFDLLIDPETGRVDLPPADWDTELEREAKERLSEVDGFGLSSHPWFEFTGEVDPSTLNGDTVKLWKLGDAPEELPARVEVLEDGIHVFVEPARLPLEEQTRYAFVVHEGVRDVDGNPVSPMPIGHFMKSTSQVAVGGESQVGAVDDEDALRLENVRQEIAPLLDRVGRDGVLTAWPFTTMTVEDELLEAVDRAAEVGVDPNPAITQRMTPGEALLDFPLAIGGIAEVDRVFHGTIETADYLDPVTRAFREDGGHEVRDIAFTMTIPRGASPEAPVPVVVFGHGIMTERRFVLAIGDALAREGFAAVAIDLPYHGQRVHCIDTSPMSLVNPRTGETVNLPPCEAGAMCSEDGRCVDSSGDAAFAMWPVINFPVASGAAFLEIETLPRIKDHFIQSLIDLGALVRSLEEGDWRGVVGQALETDTLYWVGQSLGGIIGATFVPLVPKFERSVLNVPGADVVDMFDDSVFFGPQVDGYFTREDIERESFQGQRFLNIARWFMDSVDPHSVAHIYRRDERDAFIQMAEGDIVIPNPKTELLASLSNLPMKTYTLTEHAFLTIPIDPAYIPGTSDMASYLVGEGAP